MSSCFGLRKPKSSEREPLLPQYDENTHRQRELHQKLHTYQMLRAIGQGYMPSTEQLIVNLRTLLASEVLNLDNPDLSETSRSLVRYTRKWLQQFMDLLQHKNEQDQIQDLLWFLSKSKIEVDVEDLTRRAKNAKAKADTAAAYQSLKTVGSLFLTNADFRIFLSDLNIVGRQVFKDSAFKLSEVAEEAGKKLEPSAEEQKTVQEPGADSIPVDTKELQDEVAEVTQVVANGSTQVAKTAVESAEEKLQGDEGKTLLNRLKQAVTKLRQRPDYSESVSTLSLLLKRYAIVYSRAAQHIVDVAEEDTHQNEELDRAAKNAWALITSFGDKEEWDKLQQCYHKILDHKEKDPRFEEMMTEAGNSLEKLLTDPDFMDNAQVKFNELQKKGKEVGSDSSVSQDYNAFLRQMNATLKSVLQDQDISNLTTTSLRIWQVLSPPGAVTNSDLVHDSINVFLPLLISAIQHIPIPRLEVSTPEVDLLLENLIIEPGKTINQSSFLPYRLRVENYNDVEIRKAKFRTTTSMTNLVTIKLDGLTARADELGFWLRAHSGILRLADEGIASVALDERGMDVHIDVEIGRERLEQILTLKDVRVHIHKLNYATRKSKFSWLGWLLKPLLRPILRKVMEKQLATALADFFHAANRELLYARERLRATRIADPQDLLTFFKAIAARLTPDEDPDVYTRVGFAAPDRAPVGKPNIFQGVYTPCSLVQVWEEEATRARERVEEFDAGGWRNEVFDTHVQTMT